MAAFVEFCVDGFLLKINRAGYLVEVHEAAIGCDCQGELGKLPDWVFHSKHAIWLSEEGASVLIRAVRGEEIKKRLLTRWQ